MSPTNPTSEEVVEKKASAPVSTACLIIACVALLGGIVFQVMEIAEYRSGTGDPKDQATKRYKADIKKVKDTVEETLSKASLGATEEAAPADATPPTPPPADGDAAPPSDATKDAAPAETPPGDAAPADADAKAAAPDDTKDAAPAEGDAEK